MELKVESLACVRSGMPVLSDVSFSVAAGEALILRGPNGSGKTTLLRTLAGLQPATEGSVKAPEDSMIYAAHADGIKGTLSVAENLQFWAALYGYRDIGPAFTAFGLKTLVNRPAQKLSAGQKRRLGLARLLVSRRPIWLLDEPTVSLDTDGVARFAEAVRNHVGAGGLAVIATHIDVGLDARVLDISQFRAKPPVLEPLA
ncbi:MAG: heme ABC exporter ATP-binding protein CcmA [Rhodobacteraceae bacterium]|nr:heme ABC exporter ATP-binding protein CcmA [Paracoccaceae bacterium]